MFFFIALEPYYFRAVLYSTRAISLFYFLGFVNSRLFPLRIMVENFIFRDDANDVCKHVIANIRYVCLTKINRAIDTYSISHSMELFGVAFDMHASFLRVIYSILNTSVILERNETCLERNKTRLARNETRGGNLHLSGTVCKYIFV